MKLIGQRTAILFFIAIGASVGWLSFFGLETWDEPLLVAQAKRFIFGGMPFVDDNGWGQLTAILLIPLLKIKLAVTGTLDGVLLFLRLAFFCGQLLLALLAFIVFEKFNSRSLALVLATLVFVLFPTGSVGFPSFSYNSLLVMVLVSVWIVHAWDPQAEKPWRAFALGALSVMGIMAHLAAGAFFAPYLLNSLLNAKNRGKFVGQVLLGALPLVAFLALLYAGPFFQARANAAAVDMGQVFPSIDLFYLLRVFTSPQTLGIRFLCINALIGWIFLYAARKKRIYLPLVFLAATGLSAVMQFQRDPGYSLTPTNLWLLFLGLMALKLTNQKMDWPYLLPSFCCWAVLSTVSTGGTGSGGNALVGVWLTVAGGCFCAAKDLKVSRSVALLARGSFCLFIVVTLGLRYRPYLTGTLLGQKSLITKGPAKGIYVTAATYDFSHAVSDFFEANRNSAGSLFVYNRSTSFFYLAAPKLPAVGQLYRCFPGDNYQSCWAELNRKLKKVCLILVNSRSELAPEDRFLKLIDNLEWKKETHPQFESFLSPREECRG